MYRIGCYCLMFALGLSSIVLAQANRDNVKDVVCAASGGASTELVPARPGRYSLAINNVSGIDIRFAGISSGTPTLSSTNSFLLKAGQPYTDSAPGLYTGRILCQSTTASTATVSIRETYR